MNIGNRPPLGLKEPDAAKDPDYLRDVRELPCCICEAFGEPQNSPTQAHHPIHDRFGTRKVPDRQAVPLCEGHHQGMFDTSKPALHRSPDGWRQHYGADHEWIAPTQGKIERIRNGRIGK